MSLTPVEVRHLELRRGLFGFRRSSVRSAMDEIADSFEIVWRERADLSQRVEDLETELERHLELETLLRSTLVSAERASQELKDQARREADVIVTEANAESRRIMRDAISEKERFASEARKVQAILRSALEVVETSWQDEPRTAEQERVAKPSVIQDTPGDTTQAFRKLTG